MWQSLRLASLGVIEEAELDLGPGFTVITGETGAGKTMVVTALGLLRGERADSALVRRGADRARIEASVVATPEVAALVEEAGGQVDDDLVLARVLTSQGRSRALAGGSTVPAGLLSRLADSLVAVHGQSDQQRLVRPQEQRGALDRYAGSEVSDLLALYQPDYERLRELKARLHDLRTHAGERLQRLDLLRHGLDEIDAVDPQPGEDEELVQRENRLAHAEALAAAAAGASVALSEDEHSAAAALAAAKSVVDPVAGNDPRLEALAERLRRAAIDLTDIASELAAYAADVDLDPAGLATVQERRAALTALQRRYGPGLDDVIAWADRARAEVLELDLDDTAIERLETEADAARDRVVELAGRLTQARTRAAEQLAEEVGRELADLALPSARLEVRVLPGEPGPHGADDVEIWFAANSGAEPRPLARAASGGELSRLMLAIEVVLAGRDPVPTLVFDEVDAGIGGRTAVEVGRRLARLAQHAQVIAVTHLPQVAAFADSHFVVSKSDDGTVTSSSVLRLEHDSRVDELARMLAGLDDSAAAQEHARELLELARTA
ncbi:DNA repair protein RecN [Aeromicrobium tamlense]|uniref:DNA repair protein RecN n=1 Tax=Aeromicrobium tamlense TaxID=375541 RepID=A0A8I0FWL3_9ACTN|nr:DNA repair protein RecN [Aeromicrobium tamlense]MBD1271093.1 DNA repair protein RecN [Aeromicrobium tamlense]NYI38484.1 DNA repair protein RecN (Recombination protein N) [Aeromicrobium tamlense]